MLHRQSLAAAAAGIVFSAGIGATIPADAGAAPPRTTRPPATAQVVDVRWGTHSTFDRLVVDVRGALPPVSVRPVKVLRYDGSGHRVPLAGRFFLEIKLSPAAAHDQSGRSVYQGPRLTRIHLPALKGVALTGDFEGVVTIGAAFDSKPVFKSFTLHSPERFVLDIAHHPAGCPR